MSDCTKEAEIVVLESNQNHATAKADNICSTLPASMGLGGGYVPMIAYVIDKNKKRLTAIGGGRVLEYSETVGALCARDFKGIGNQYVNEGKLVVLCKSK